MIRLICTNCQTELQIDDAFAGGVCRCQHCGTIQTVPARADTTGATVSQASGKGAKTLYQRKIKVDGFQGSGLDQLAEIVASSGLSSSRLRKPARGQPGPAGKKPAGLPMPVIIGGGAAIVILLALCIGLLMRSGTPASPVTTPPPISTGGGGETSPVVTPQPVGPVFLDVKLEVPSVIFVLDRGQGTKELFSALKQAALTSIASLGSERKFQMIFWSVEGPEVAYPNDMLTFATPENVESCRRAVDEVFASGSSDATKAMQAAFARQPAIIILATGKGWGLDESFVKSIMDVKGSSQSKVFTFSLVGQSSSGTSTALKELARQTGGQYREVKEGELRAAGR